MKAIILLALAVFGATLFTGCEGDEHHHHGYYGRPPAYDYGVGPRYDQGWDQR